VVIKCDVCKKEIKEDDRRFYVMHACAELYRDSWDQIFVICPGCFFNQTAFK